MLEAIRIAVAEEFVIGDRIIGDPYAISGSAMAHTETIARRLAKTVLKSKTVNLIQG